MIIPGMTNENTESDIILPGEYATPDDRAIDNSFKTAMEYNPVNLLASGITSVGLDVLGKPIGADEARKIYSDIGIEPQKDDLSGSLTLEGTSRRARIAYEQMVRDAEISRARQSTSLSTKMLAASFGAQFLDPINYAAGALSMMAAPAFVAGVASKGFGAGKAYKAAVRLNTAKASQATALQAFWRGAVEGVAGNVLLEVPTYQLANYSGYDYTMTDALMGIAIGAPFGGVIHAAPKVWRNARQAINKQNKKALLDDGMPDDIRQSLSDEIADDDIGDFAMPESIRERVDIEAEAGLIPSQQNNKKIREALKEAAPERADDIDLIPTRNLTEEFDLLRSEAESLGLSLDGIAPVREAAPRAETDFDVAAAAIKADIDSMPAREQVVETPEAIAEREQGVITDSDLPMAKYEAVGITKDMSVADIAKRLRDISEEKRQKQIISSELSNVINASDDAAEMIQSVSPETRVAAHGIATRQMLEGNPIDIDPVLALDSKSGKPRPTGDDIANIMSDKVDQRGLNAYDDMPTAEQVKSMDVPPKDSDVQAIQTEAQKAQEKSKPREKPPTVADVESEVRKSFGKHTKKIMESGKITVVKSAGDIPVPKREAPKLPKGLSGAKPRYKTNTIKFESDIDRAIYIVGGKKIDKETGKIKKSKSHDLYVKFLADNGISEKDANNLIKGVKDKIKTAEKDAVDGEITVAASDDVAYAKMGDDVVGAMTPDGRVYIVADNIDPSVNIQGLVLHEIGVHVGMRDMLGDVQFQRVLDDISASDNPRVKEAREQVPDNTPPDKIAEETLAYLVQNEPQSNFVRNVIGAVKAWLMRTFKMNMSVDEFTARHLAVGALRRVSKLGDPSGTGTIMFSRKKTKVEPERDRLAEELSIFDDALVKVQNYEPAFRAALESFGDEPAMRSKLRENGVTPDMLDFVLGVMTERHRDVAKIIRRKIKAVTGESTLEQINPSADQMAAAMLESIQEKLTRDKVNAMRSFVAREKAFQRYQRFGLGFAYESISSILTGSSMLRQGARENIASLHTAYLGGWVGALESGLKREKLWTVFTSGALERDIAKALERMDDAKPDFSGINAKAVNIARAVYRVRENARLTQNSMGANIKQYRNYITRQSHDQIKIRKAEFKQWYKDIIDNLDLAAMNLPLKDAPRVLKEVYNEIISGKYQVESLSDATILDYRLKGGANIAKRVSASREIIFKKDKWFDYNQKYGSNTLTASLIKSLDKAARDSALMRVLGPNPQNNLDRIIDLVERDLVARDPEGSRLFNKNKKDALRAQLYHLDGRANIPGDVGFATINSNLRMINVMGLLGQSVFSGITNIPIYARNFQYEGRGNIFAGIAEGIKNITSNFSKGSNRQILEGLEIAFENDIGDLLNQFSKHGTFSDNMSAAVRIYTKFNLDVPFTTRLHKGQTAALSNFLAKSANLSFDKLSDEIKRIFSIHNITGAKWDIIRKAIGTADDGRTYIDTRLLTNTDDATMTKYIESLGRKATPVSIQRAKESLVVDVRSMFFDRAEYAMPSRDVRTKALILGETTPGELWGEMRRHIAQFKTFPVMFYERVLKREVYGRGYDSLADYWARGKGDMVGFANFMCSLFAFAYIGMSAKDALQGREPRPLDKAGTWVEIMRRSGGLGLYGDFLFQDYDRNQGAVLAESILGPTFGTAGDIAEIVTAAVNGDKFATKALRTLQSNVPGANLFYVKPVLDNLIMWNLYEAANPGYLRRMQGNVEERTGQQFFAPPAQTALQY